MSLVVKFKALNLEVVVLKILNVITSFSILHPLTPFFIEVTIESGVISLPGFVILSLNLVLVSR